MPANPEFYIERGFALDEKCRGDLVYAAPEVCAKTEKIERRLRQHGNCQGVIICPASGNVTHTLRYNDTRDQHFGSRETLEAERVPVYDGSREITRGGTAYLIIPKKKPFLKVGDYLKAAASYQTKSPETSLMVSLGMNADVPHPALADGLMQYQIERRRGADPKQTFPSAGSSEDTGRTPS